MFGVAGEGAGALGVAAAGVAPAGVAAGEAPPVAPTAGEGVGVGPAAALPDAEACLWPFLPPLWCAPCFLPPCI